MSSIGPITVFFGGNTVTILNYGSLDPVTPGWLVSGTGLVEGRVLSVIPRSVTQNNTVIITLEPGQLFLSSGSYYFSSSPSHVVLLSSDSTIRPLCDINTLQYFWNPPIYDGDGSGISSYTVTYENLNTSLVSTTTVPAVSTNLTVNVTTHDEYSSYIIATTNYGNTSYPVNFRNVIPGTPVSTDVPNVYVSSVINPSTLVLGWNWNGSTPSFSSPVSQPYWYTVTGEASDPAVSTIRLSAKFENNALEVKKLVKGVNTNTPYTFLVQSVNDPGYSSYNAYQTNFIPRENLLIWLDMSDLAAGWTSTSTTVVSTIVDKSDNGYTMNALVPNTSLFGTSELPNIGTPINNLTTASFSTFTGIKQSVNINGVTDFFWVGRELGASIYGGAGLNPFLLGDDVNFDWEGAGSNYIDSLYSSAGIQNASTTIFYNGGSTTSNFNKISTVSQGSVFMLSAHGITGDTRFQGLCYDRTYNSGWIGDFGELICYNSNLNPTQITNIETYLLKKWGIT